MITVSVASASSPSERREARVALNPPTLFCAISNADADLQRAKRAESVGRDSSQRGLVMEFPAVAAFATELRDDDAIHVTIDFSRFMSFLRRSVTVIAEPVNCKRVTRSSMQKDDVEKESVAIPGYVDTTTAAAASNNSNNGNDDDNEDERRSSQQQKSIKWVGRLDLAKFGAKLFKNDATGNENSSPRRALRFRLVLGGHLVHCAPNKSKKEEEAFTIIAPTFPSIAATPTVAKIVAVALDPAGRRVEVSSAFLVEQHVVSDGSGSSYRSVGTLEVVFAERSADKGGVSNKSKQQQQAQATIEVRAQDPQALFRAQENRAVDVLLELKIVDEASLDVTDRFIIWAKQKMPASSPWFVFAFFVVLLMALVATAVVISVRQSKEEVPRFEWEEEL